MKKDFSISELIPHEGKMSLIDNLVSYDIEKKQAVVSLTVREDDIFFEKSISGVPNWVGIEYMAQAAAALAGVQDKIIAGDENSSAKPGLLLGTRKLNLDFEKFELGKTYFIEAINSYNENGLASFECSIRDDAQNILAEASLTAYRPQDMDDFLKREGVI
ncbi:MAG: 3-hydroxylacyl-ACP dehydratase [Kiritimatiellae bacterium]|nr:3-hydroxylacyl-ACP dehydratase [Kiritimatiellia bacterium]